MSLSREILVYDGCRNLSSIYRVKPFHSIFECIYLQNYNSLSVSRVYHFKGEMKIELFVTFLSLIQVTANK